MAYFFLQSALPDAGGCLWLHSDRGLGIQDQGSKTRGEHPRGLAGEGPGLLGFSKGCPVYVCVSVCTAAPVLEHWDTPQCSPNNKFDQPRSASWTLQPLLGVESREPRIE